MENTCQILVIICYTYVKLFYKVQTVDRYLYLQILLKHKDKFATENLIMQYWGLIKNNMKTIEQGKYKNQPRERKVFYQVKFNAEKLNRECFYIETILLICLLLQ